MLVEMAVEATMVNEHYEPNESEEQILEFLQGEPCGRVTNRYVREETGDARRTS